MLSCSSLNSNSSNEDISWINCSLPNEILFKVFEYVLTDNSNVDVLKNGNIPTSSNSLSNVLAMRSVCQKWNHVISFSKMLNSHLSLLTVK